MSQPSVNYWDKFKSNEGFLSYLRNSSHARNFCRQIIINAVDQKHAGSLLEVGIGGMNEFIALKPFFDDRPFLRFIGTDWTETFVRKAQESYPDYQFEQVDITSNVDQEKFGSDIVYSQHVLEHCPGLNPPLANMLKLTNKLLLNIFFIPPQTEETINHDKYPLYHNIYSAKHIMQVCEFHGFSAQFFPFSNADQPDANECQSEVVLMAVRNGCSLDANTTKA